MASIKTNDMSHKITTLTIPIPYKRAGNIISQEQVSFDLFSEEGQYQLVPLLNEEERRIANLPPELRFVINDGRPVSLRGIRDGNFHIIQDAVALVLKQNMVL